MKQAFMKTPPLLSSIALLLPLVFFLACGPAAREAVASGATFAPDPSPRSSPAPKAGAAVPGFGHIAVFVFENKEFGTVVGNPALPHFNDYAKRYVLLTAYYAVIHPSLPNYLALIGGDTFGIASDCTGCSVNAPNLADLIERSGRTWKAYQEDLPAPGFAGDSSLYKQKHDPFVYFDSIRLDRARLEKHIVPLDRLEADAASGALPHFVFVTPNICHDAHDCPVAVADEWLGRWVPVVQRAFAAAGGPYLIALTWDEGTSDRSCCGLPARAGGRVATVLVSPQAKAGFLDATPYTHYSLLKTILRAWRLPDLGHSADPGVTPITEPWVRP
jgi:hypothetical protein